MWQEASTYCQGTINKWQRCERSKTVKNHQNIQMSLLLGRLLIQVSFRTFKCHYHAGSGAEMNSSHRYENISGFTASKKRVSSALIWERKKNSSEIVFVLLGYFLFSFPRFYIAKSLSNLNDYDDEDEDRFFENVTSLYHRQTMLFQRSCEQIKVRRDATYNDRNYNRPIISKSQNLSIGVSWLHKPRRSRDFEALKFRKNFGQEYSLAIKIIYFHQDLSDLDLYSNSSIATASTTSNNNGKPGGGRRVVTPPSPSPFGEINSADIEELYVDCVYTVLHMIGCDSDRGAQFELVEHLRKAFR